MAGARFEKGSEEWMMFMDFWQLCQKYWIPEKDDKYWDDFAEELRLFDKKFSEIPMARHLAFAILNFMEEKGCQN